MYGCPFSNAVLSAENSRVRYDGPQFHTVRVRFDENRASCSKVKGTWVGASTHTYQTLRVLKPTFFARQQRKLRSFYINLEVITVELFQYGQSAAKYDANLRNPRQ